MHVRWSDCARLRYRSTAGANQAEQIYQIHPALSALFVPRLDRRVLGAWGAPLGPRRVLIHERLWGRQRRLHVRGGTGIEPDAKRERPGGPIAVLRVGADDVRLQALRKKSRLLVLLTISASSVSPAKSLKCSI